MQRLNQLRRSQSVTAIAVVLSVFCHLGSSDLLVAADSNVDVSRYATAVQAITQGESLEANRQWVDAIRFYEAALESDRFAGNEDLKYALRRTRVHFAIDRRYSDASFENKMLQQGRSEALDLMEDVMTRVQLEYVENVSATKFVSHGTESFYMALGNQRFLSTVAKNPQKEAVTRVRQELIRNFWNRRVASRLEARMIVTKVCELADRELDIPSAAVVMEYLFGGCNALDDYSNFLTPDRYNDLFGSIQGEFVGIGIEMEADKGKSPYSGSSYMSRFIKDYIKTTSRKANNWR